MGDLLSKKIGRKFYPVRGYSPDIFLIPLKNRFEYQISEKKTRTREDGQK